MSIVCDITVGISCGMIGGTAMAYAVHKRQRINAIGSKIGDWFVDHFIMPYDGERSRDVKTDLPTYGHEVLRQHDLATTAAARMIQPYSETKLAHSRKIEAVLPVVWGQLLVHGRHDQIKDDELEAMSIWLVKHGLHMHDLHHAKPDEHHAVWHAAWAEWPFPSICQTFVFYTDRSEAGSTTIEYALLAAIIGVVLVVGLHMVGLSIAHVFSVLP